MIIDSRHTTVVDLPVPIYEYERTEEWIQVTITHQTFDGENYVLISEALASSDTIELYYVVEGDDSVRANKDRGISDQELNGWLTLAEEAFDFWDNDKDAMYDKL